MKPGFITKSKPKSFDLGIEITKTFTKKGGVCCLSDLHELQKIWLVTQTVYHTNCDMSRVGFGELDGRVDLGDFVRGNEGGTPV